jgi:hypothetical protein
VARDHGPYRGLEVDRFAGPASSRAREEAGVGLEDGRRSVSCIGPSRGGSSGGRGDAAKITVTQLVAVALERGDLGVADQPVDHRGCGDVVAEDLAPPPRGFVGGHDQRGALVAGTDELEDQVGGLGLEGLFTSAGK